jgi:hypothetical protein
VEGTDLRAGGHGRRQDIGAQRTAGVDHGLAAVQPNAPGQFGQRVVGDGQDDELDLLDERLGLGERAGTLDLAGEALAATGVAAGHGVDRPASPGHGYAQRRAHRSPADDAGDGPLARTRVLVGMGVSVGMDLPVGPVAMVTGRHRVKVDAGGVDGRLGVGPVALGVVARQGAPGLHRVPAPGARRSRYASTHRV